MVSHNGKLPPSTYPGGIRSHDPNLRSRETILVDHADIRLIFLRVGVRISTPEHATEEDPLPLDAVFIIVPYRDHYYKL
jgi:hypothetical protein